MTILSSVTCKKSVDKYGLDIPPTPPSSKPSLICDLHLALLTLVN